MCMIFDAVVTRIYTIELKVSLFTNPHSHIVKRPYKNLHNRIERITTPTTTESFLELESTQ